MLWFLELNGDVTDINIEDVSTEESILLDLEDTLGIEYSEDFPYGCYDIEIMCRSETVIEINIIHESHFSNNMEKTYAMIRKM